MSTGTPTPPAPTQAGGGKPRRRRWLIALGVALAVVIVVVAVIGVIVYRALNPPVPACTKAADPTRSGAISQYCPDGYQPGSSMTIGSDGNVWFPSDSQKLARMTPQSETVTEFAAPSAPAIAENGLVRGRDGAVWYIANDKVGRVTMSGQVTEFALPKELGLARSVVAGPDGTLWVKMGPNDPAQKNGLVRVPTTGATVGVPVIMQTWSTESEGWGGTAGAGAPDGSLWAPTSSGVTRVAPTGSVMQIPLNISSGIAGLTAGPDGAMWFIAGNGRAGRITLSGAITYFGDTSIGKTDNLSILAGPDGNLWFTTQVPPSMQPTLGRITPAGMVTTYTIPDAQSITNMTAGSDGGVWFLAWYPSGGFESPFARITRITP